MKRIVILSAVLCALALSVCGCAKKDTGLVSFEPSDEAKAHGEKLLAAKAPAMSYEETLVTMQTYEGAGLVQTLPEAEVKNQIGMETVLGSSVYTLETGNGYDCIVLYIHGGAWTFEISPLHITFCDELAARMNAKVYMPLYPLSPQFNSDDTYAMLMELYQELLKEGKPIYVMGDSAGGNLTMGVAYLAKQNGLPMPEKLVLLSLCADLAMTNPEMEVIEPKDPVLSVGYCRACGEVWADGKDLKDPLLSPVYADTAGYPDTMIIFGTNDILYPDGKILYENMKKAGNKVTFVEARGLWHVYPVSDIPEREKTLEQIREFCEK